MSSKPNRRGKPFWQWTVVFLCLALGFVTAGWEGGEWTVAVILLHSVPLAFQLTPGAFFRRLGLLLGGVLIAQSFLSALLIDHDYHTLPVDLDATVEVRGDFPGLGQRHRLTTDGKGYRVTGVIDYVNKPEGTVRVFAVGGSTTAEALIDDLKTWTHLLQEKIGRRLSPGRVEVINTGRSGLRARHHLATLERIVPYDPDVVIFLVGVNDWNRHIKDSLGSTAARVRSMLRPFSFRYSWAGRILREGRWRLKGGGEKKTAIMETGESYLPWKDSLNRPDRRRFDPGSVSPEYAHYLERLFELCGEGDFLCVFSTQPHAYQAGVPEDLRKRFWMTPAEETFTLDFDAMAGIADLYNGHLRDSAAGKGVVLCDAAAGMPASTDTFYDDCHFNVGGSARFADLIDRCLADLNLP